MSGSMSSARAGTLASTLLAQENAPAADLVIGLDELTAPQADADLLLVPYAPPSSPTSPRRSPPELSPDDAVVPYEWGYLGIDYNQSFATNTQGAIAHATFPEFAENASWARQLLIEDPSIDITGEEFLVWEIEYYEHVLHQNWQDFWKAVLPEYPPTGDRLGDRLRGIHQSDRQPPARGLLHDRPGLRRLLRRGRPTYNSTVSWWNGTAYGWRTIYGIGIVAGTHHLTLDQEFEDWFLGGEVQNLIPLNEWEYPANDTVALPGVYAAALDPSTITPLNADTSPSQVASNLTGWVDDWLTLATGTE